jgi:hypothetical protein
MDGTVLLFVFIATGIHWLFKWGKEWHFALCPTECPHIDAAVIRLVLVLTATGDHFGCHPARGTETRGTLLGSAS